MSKKWTKAQHKKFVATMAAKRAAKEEQHFPIEAIPDRPIVRSNGGSKPNKAIRFEVQPGSEFAVTLGDYRVEVKVPSQ